MNVEIGTEHPLFLFWEYLLRNFGILSLQCSNVIELEMNYFNKLKLKQKCDHLLKPIYNPI
jgi:hypothetical protein